MEIYIDDHFKSKILEPRIIIFEDDESILQMFIVGENDSLIELPTTSTIGQGLVYLMAAYYVFNVGYPKPYQPLLYFIQDFIMNKTDNGKRPTRYSSFAACYFRGQSNNTLPRANLTRLFLQCSKSCPSRGWHHQSTTWLNLEKWTKRQEQVQTLPSQLGSWLFSCSSAR